MSMVGMSSVGLTHELVVSVFEIAMATREGKFIEES